MSPALTSNNRIRNNTAPDRDDCVSCNGSGRWEFEFIDDDPVTVEVEPCRVCNGTGAAP